MPEKIYCTLYEKEDLRQITGETLRPGGLELTQRALAFCKLPVTARILDVGSGRGTTLQCLKQADYRPFGIDASPSLLRACRDKADFPLIQGMGESLPIASGVMNAVTAECTLSLMTDPALALAEMGRVLSPQGWLIVSDLYARNLLGIPGLRQLQMQSFISRMMPQAEIVKAIEAAGFELLVWEDHSSALRYLTGKIILESGSLPAFWRKVTDQSPTVSCDALDIQITISKAKPGYYLAVARKTKTPSSTVYRG